MTSASQLGIWHLQKPVSMLQLLQSYLLTEEKRAAWDHSCGPVAHLPHAQPMRLPLAAFTPAMTVHHQKGTVAAEGTPCEATEATTEATTPCCLDIAALRATVSCVLVSVFLSVNFSGRNWLVVGHVITGANFEGLLPCHHLQAVACHLCGSLVLQLVQ